MLFACAVAVVVCGHILHSTRRQKAKEEKKTPANMRHANEVQEKRESNRNICKDIHLRNANSRNGPPLILSLNSHHMLY